MNEHTISHYTILHPFLIWPAQILESIEHLQRGVGGRRGGGSIQVVNVRSIHVVDVHSIHEVDVHNIQYMQTLYGKYRIHTKTA